MKWFGWICAMVGLCALIGTNVSGGKKLRAQKAYLDGIEERAATEKANIIKTEESRTAVLADAVADKQAKLEQAKAELAELETQHAALNKRVAELRQHTTARPSTPVETPRRSPQPVVASPAPAPAPAPAAANPARVATLEAEIRELRSKLDSVTLR